MEDTLLKVLNIPIATSGNPLGEYTHINNIIGPAIGVGGTTYNLIALKSTIISRILVPKRCLVRPPSKVMSVHCHCNSTQTMSNNRKAVRP